MSKVKLKIIGSYISLIWIISMTVSVDGAFVKIGSEQRSAALMKPRQLSFEDFKAEAEVYSESQKILRLKITWNPKMTNDSTFHVLVEPIEGGQCHEEWCDLHGQITKNATLFIPNEPTIDGIHTHTCQIMPACNYTITVQSDKFKSKISYTVPDRVGNVYSCHHISDLPTVKTNVTIDSQIMTISWEINESFQVPNDIKVYIVVRITKINAAESLDMEVFNQTLNDTKAQSGQFIWSIPIFGEHYLIRTYVFDSNECKSLPVALPVYATPIIEPDPGKTPKFSDELESNYSVHVLWLVIGMTTSIIILIVFLIYFHKAKQTNAIKLICTYGGRTASNGFEGLRGAMVENPNYDILDDIPSEIPYSSLQLLKEIGGGAFGRVYLARAENIRGKPGLQYVAVKQLKKRPTEEEKEEFLSEIQTMKTVSRHLNIVALLGYCTRREPLQMVMEYVGCGDLLKYLGELRAKHQERFSGNRNMNPCQMFTSGITRISAEPHHPLLPSPFGKYLDLMNSSTASTSDSSYATDTEGINLRPSVTETMYTTLSQNQDQRSSTTSSLEYVLDHKELHNFATQIAKGMKHLHEKQITHRDLAARNILIDENKTLKISDFGLSRSGIYVNTKNKKVPLRWLSIEAIRDNLYSDKSDVWAFGIVLWEIGTLGGYPYPTVNNHELLTYLSEGYRLEQPENFSKYLYELMLQCWADHSTSVILPGYTHHAVGGIDAGNISRIYTFISYGALISAVRRTLGVELLRKSLRRCYGVLRTLY